MNQRKGTSWRVHTTEALRNFEHGQILLNENERRRSTTDRRTPHQLSDCPGRFDFFEKLKKLSSPISAAVINRGNLPSRVLLERIPPAQRNAQYLSSIFSFTESQSSTSLLSSFLAVHNTVFQIS